MFLSRLARLARTARSVGTDDRGIALAAVLTFMAAGVLLSAVVASTVVSGLQVSQSTRAGVQSQAAAEAGIAVARASLMNGDCVVPATYSSAGALDDPGTLAIDETLPAYDAQIQYSLDNGTTWTDGCPPSVQHPARILSTGYAITPAMGANDLGEETTIEARLDTVQNAGTLNPSGPAVYSYNTSGFGGSGKLISTGGYDASIMIRSGNVTCDGAANGAADLVVKSGNFIGGGSCVVTGNVWVNGWAELSGGGRIGGSLTAGSVVSSGDIGGNVWSDSTLRLTWSGVVSGWVSGGSLDIAGGIVRQNAWARTGTTLLSGNGVDGTVYSQGAVTLSNGTTKNVVTTAAATITGGTLSGSLSAPSLTMTNGTLAAAAITGPACFKGGELTGPVKVGSISSASGCYTKAGNPRWSGWSRVTTGPSSSPSLPASPGKPSAVVVPEWVDFGSDPADLTPSTWSGYTLYTMGTDCSDARFYQALRAIGSAKGLIDARSCSNGLTYGGGSGEQTGQGQNAHGFRLRNDIAIIGHKFDFSGSMRFFSDSGAPVNVWLINPDTIANSSPDCGGQSLKVSGGFYVENVNLMFYTPCAITISSSQNLKGQIFAGSNVTFGGAGILDYIPLGLPGYNLDTGVDDGATYTEADRGLAWQRNVNEAG